MTKAEKQVVRILAGYATRHQEESKALMEVAYRLFQLYDGEIQDASNPFEWNK